MTSTPRRSTSSAAWRAASWTTAASPADSQPTGDREAAVEGAGFVLVQRVGGLAARLLDETIPPSSDAWARRRPAPADSPRRFARCRWCSTSPRYGQAGAEGAWLLDFTNPAGLVTQALADDEHHAIGLCNIPIGFQRTFADRLGVEPEQVALEHVGLNHLWWERAVMVDGEDRLPGLIDVFADRWARRSARPATSCGRSARSLVLPAVFRLPPRDGRRARDGGQAGGAGHGIGGAPRWMYRDPGASRGSRSCSKSGAERGHSRRPPRCSSSRSISTAATSQIVNVRTRARSPTSTPDAVVEVPCRITSLGADPLPQRPYCLPRGLGLVEQVKAYEAPDRRRRAERRSGEALRALVANPLAGEFATAAPMLDALLEAHSQRPACFHA